MNKLIDWLEKGNNCLLVALAFASFIYALSFHLPTEIKILLTYNSGLLNYIILLLFITTKGNHEQLAKFLKNRKNNIRFTLILSLIAFVVNLIIVAFMLHASKDWSVLWKNTHLGLSISAIILSWFLVHLGFSLTYAHLYYETISIDEKSDRRLGLNFPQDDPPVFWDFMYFSFVIGMCFQTSDVEISNSFLRRFVLGHSIISFLFVSGIIGMLINIIANVI